MNGTVICYGASIRTKEFNTLKLQALLAKLVEKVGLEGRRFDVEDYEKPEGARTIVLYLNESHAMFTTYPESSILEFEIASCVDLQLSPMIAYIKKNYVLITDYLQKKDGNGIWRT